MDSIFHVDINWCIAEIDKSNFEIKDVFFTYSNILSCKQIDNNMFILTRDKNNNRLARVIHFNIEKKEVIDTYEFESKNNAFAKDISVERIQ